MMRSLHTIGWSIMDLWRSARPVFGKAAPPAGPGGAEQVEGIDSSVGIEDLSLVETLKGLDESTGEAAIRRRFSEVKAGLEKRLGIGADTVKANDSIQATKEAGVDSGKLARALKKIYDHVQEIEERFVSLFKNVEKREDRDLLLHRAEKRFDSWMDAFVETAGADENTPDAADDTFEYADLLLIQDVMPALDTLTRIAAPTSEELMGAPSDTEAQKKMAEFFTGIGDQMKAIKTGLGANVDNLTGDQEDFIRQAVLVPVLDLLRSLSADKKSRNPEHQKRAGALEPLAGEMFNDLAGDFKSLGMDPYREQARSAARDGYTNVNGDNAKEFFEGNPWASILQKILSFFGVNMEIDNNGIVAGFGDTSSQAIRDHIGRTIDASRESVDKADWSPALREVVSELHKKFENVADLDLTAFDSKLAVLREGLKGRLADPDAFLAGRLRQFLDSGSSLTMNSRVAEWDGKSAKDMPPSVLLKWLESEAVAEKARVDAAAVAAVGPVGPAVGPKPKPVPVDYEKMLENVQPPELDAQSTMLQQLLLNGPPFSEEAMKQSIIPLLRLAEYFNTSAEKPFTLEEMRSASIKQSEQKLSIGGVFFGLDIPLEHKDPVKGDDAVRLLYLPKFKGSHEAAQIDLYALLEGLKNLTKNFSEEQLEKPFSAKDTLKYLRSPGFLERSIGMSTLIDSSAFGVDAEAFTSFTTQLARFLLLQNKMNSGSETFTSSDWYKKINALDTHSSWEEEDVRSLIMLRYLLRTRAVPDSGPMSLAAYVSSVQKVPIAATAIVGASDQMLQMKFNPDTREQRYDYITGIGNASRREGLKKDNDLVLSSIYMKEIIDFGNLFAYTQRNAHLFFRTADYDKNAGTASWTESRAVISAILEQFGRYIGSGGKIPKDNMAFECNGVSYDLNAAWFSQLPYFHQLATTNPIFQELLQTDSEMTLPSLFTSLFHPSTSDIEV